MADLNIKRSAEIALAQCLKLQRKESLLVVTDDKCEDVGRAFWDVGRSMCREAVTIMMTPRKENGNEPPAELGNIMENFDVAVLATYKSLSHTEARRKASEKGCRIASLPGITEDVFVRTMNTDWNKLGSITRIIAAKITAAKEVRIVTSLGTDLRFSIEGRKAVADDGGINTPGAFGNLPAGEAYIAPVEGSAEGKIVYDGSFPFAGKLKEPFTVYVRNGRVTRVNQHECSNKLKEIFSIYGENARNIAEFGVGTLDSAIISGNILEDEKVKGTIHIALGDNASMGGNVKVPVHLDGIIKRPTVYLDGKLWMERGIIKGL